MATGFKRYRCGDIHSPASLETLDSYSDNLDFYAERGFSYVPMPLDMAYYDRTAGELKQMDEDQFIDADTPLFEALETLLAYPFVLTRDVPSYGYRVEDGELQMVGMIKGVNAWDIVDEYPEVRQQVLELEEGKRWGIITHADANRRASRAALYMLFVAIEQEFAAQINQQFPDSTQLLDEVGGKTAKRWKEDHDAELDVHISEYMHLYEMKELIEDIDELRIAWGFESKSQFDSHFGGPVSMRNKIMHPTRTLVHEKKDFEKLLDRVDRMKEALDRVAFADDDSLS